MKKVIDTFMKIIIAILSLILVIRLIDNFTDNYRWGYGPEILLELAVIILIIYPMTKAIGEIIKLSVNDTLENKTNLWKMLIIVQFINSLTSFFDLLFNDSIDIITIINFVALVYCIMQYKISLNKLKISMMKQIIDLQIKLIK